MANSDDGGDAFLLEVGRAKVDGSRQRPHHLLVSHRGEIIKLKVKINRKIIKNGK